ncbi:hypothetical protein SAMN04487916_1112 [Arthrobacter sp. ov407]|nr:hypothetical protein SAMN04487916_1112 [Arthrobacter sp. ov407]
MRSLTHSLPVAADAEVSLDGLAPPGHGGFEGLPAVACQNHCVDTPDPLTVNWPSVLFALLVDSLLVWVPASLVFFLAPEHALPLAAGSALATVAANWTLYSHGTTLGTYLAGFRIRTRNGQAPGRTYGLVLALLTFASVPAIAVLIAVNFAPGNDASGPLGSPASYPLFGERTSRRRLLHAADDYWERWS